MDCEKIREIIPQYVNHSSSEENTQLIEEHLCICEGCREYLGNLLDKKDTYHPKDSLEVDTKEAKDKRIDLFTITVLIAGILIVFFSLYLIFRV